MLVVGIDPSAKKIAFVAWSDLPAISYAQAYTLYEKRQTRQTIASIAEAVTATKDFIAWADRVAPRGKVRRLACVENPLVGRGGVTTTMKQAYVGGVIRAHLHLADFEVSDINVSTWKKSLTGRGDAKKPDVMRVVRTAWPKIGGLIGDDGDLADAAGICLTHRDAVRRELALAGPAGGILQGP